MRKRARVVSRVVLLLAVLLGGSLVSRVWAGLTEGIAAYLGGDYTTAYREFLPLAEQGHVLAQTSLGFMYREGRGAPQDDTIAVIWFRKAAEQGHALAQASLGVMYTLGQGVPQNYVQAHVWFNLAASELPPGTGRDMAVRHRDLVAAKMTRAQLAEAQRRAREWRPKSP